MIEHLELLCFCTQCNLLKPESLGHSHTAIFSEQLFSSIHFLLFFVYLQSLDNILKCINIFYTTKHIIKCIIQISLLIFYPINFKQNFKNVSIKTLIGIKNWYNLKKFCKLLCNLVDYIKSCDFIYLKVSDMLILG